MATWGLGKKAVAATMGLATGSGGLLFALDESVKAEGLELHAPKLPWSHAGVFDAYDHESIRRGYQVYKQVCAACHSMKFLSYRHLVGVTHTKEEALAEARENSITDGPDRKGLMFQRPGVLFDRFPKPFPNEEAAAAANNGACPPDLSYIVLGRHGGENYIYHLLNGYCDPPAGITIEEGQNFNPYFSGGAIGMAAPLYNEIIEYEDGTPATQSQLAKDVVTFLAWAASPEADIRKKMLIKACAMSVTIFGFVWYMKRHKFSYLKARKIVYAPRKYD